MIPTVGRVVYYKARGSADGVFPKKDRAAIVTDVMEVSVMDKPAGHKVRLAVLNPEGIFFSDWLSQGQEGGQWDWMPFQKHQATLSTNGSQELKPGGVIPVESVEADALV